MMETLSTPLINIAFFLAGLVAGNIISLVWYAVGRKSHAPETTIGIMPKLDRKPKVPYHDNQPDQFEEALRDDGGRVETMRQ